MKALRETGFRRALRFLWVSVLLSLLRRAWVPPVRTTFLRLCGADIGDHVIIHRLTLINVDRGGFGALHVGNSCFIGDEVLIDLAAPVVLEDHVTLAARAVVLTHLNVGYRDHPLQDRYPAETAAVTIRRGSFIGACATVLAGAEIGPRAFIAAASLVNRSVGPDETVGGVPVRTLSSAAAKDQPTDSVRGSMTAEGR
jgi:acetyltransferase-like isoleucine patch superfamily enzyme